MGKKRKLTAVEEKTLGNEAYHAGDFHLALERYTKAIEKGVKEAKSERALFHLNRAQALIKLEKWEAAETDCTTAISLTGEATKSKAYGRRAIARKELGTRVKLRAAIDDLRKWHALILKEEPRDKAKNSTHLQQEVEAIEKRLREETASTSTPSKSRSNDAPSTSSAPVPDFPPLKDLSDALPLATQTSTLEEKLATIRSSYQQLSQLWASKKGEMVTAWMDLVVRDIRRARCRQAVNGLMEMGSLRDYPELRSNHLAEGNNILDLVSARALRDPATFAHALDAIRARTIVVAQQPPPPPEVVFGIVPRPPEEPIRAYMSVLDDGNDLYGKVTQVDLKSSESRSTCDRLLEVGDAVKAEVGEVMIERQRVLYVGALRAARVLLDLAGDDPEVDEEVVGEYEEQIKSREYAGREDYSLDRVEEIVRSSMAYSEDYYEFLRTDGEFVSEQILDRIPTTVKPASAVFMMLAKEETIVLILNAFARQSIWNECLAVISELRKHDPRCGTSVSIPLSDDYIRKIGLLAKLVEAFIGLAFKELSQAIEKCFAEEFKKMGNRHDDSFLSAMRAAAEFYGFSPRRSQQDGDPLAKMFKALTKLDPATNRKSTFEIVACLNELKELFDRSPDQKNRLSRRLVDGLGEYQDAIELRETILDAHRPWFNTSLADRSTFLANLNPLWTSLERAWLRSASDQSSLRNVLDTSSRSSLDAVWAAFDRQCIKDCKYTPDRLFGRLATIDGTTPKEQEESSEESDSEDSDEEGSDEDDGPPPLISGSDDEVPPLDQDSDEDDGPPRLLRESSDEEEEKTSYRTRRPPPTRKVPSTRRPVTARPVQPGPSSGLAPSRRAQPPIDQSAVTDAALFGTRDGKRDTFDEEEEEEPKKREKVKTRKGPSGAAEDEGDMSDATVRGGTSSSEWETTDSESEREGLPADFKFKVSRRVYETFELILGGDGVVRTEVPWIDFRFAMQSIGFQSMKGAGSTWKFRPPLRFRRLGTMVIHEPHPASALRVFQVHKIEARLQRRYKMHISMFTIDNSQRREAATVTH